MSANTLLLRLEGAMQAWGDQQSKFVVRRTAEAPTKSGVFGLLLAALGVPREEAPEKWLPRLRELRMGVRVDRPGVRWWDYHTVGAHMQMRTAEGKTREGALLTRREYLCDASFLVALQGDPELVAGLEAAVRKPRWAPYLGRKACPPSRPLPEMGQPTGTFDSLIAALCSVPWWYRDEDKATPPARQLDCLLDWQPSAGESEAPPDALVWYDVPTSLAPLAYEPRFVVRHVLTVGNDDGVFTQSMYPSMPSPKRRRQLYQNAGYIAARERRWLHDNYVSVFCKSALTPRTRTAHHVTYERAGGLELNENLRSLCRLCHDAVSMLEYGHGMDTIRIKPEDPDWRDAILAKRREIVELRSLARRRRGLAPEEVE